MFLITICSKKPFLRKQLFVKHHKIMPKGRDGYSLEGATNSREDVGSTSRGVSCTEGGWKMAEVANLRSLKDSII